MGTPKSYMKSFSYDDLKGLAYIISSKPVFTLIEFKYEGEEILNAELANSLKMLYVVNY